MVYRIGTIIFKTSYDHISIDNHTVTIVYSTPVKCPKSKVLQGQQSSVVLLVCVVNLMDVDFPHMSKSVAPQKYPP